MKWPWRRLRRLKEHPNGGGEAKQAKVDAEAALRAAEERWPEVHHARNLFADQVEQAWARRRRHP